MILNKTEAGKELISYYEERKNFMPEHRKALVGLITDYLIATLKKRASHSVIGDLSGQICLLFRNEEKVFILDFITPEIISFLDRCFIHTLI